MRHGKFSSQWGGITILVKHVFLVDAVSCLGHSDGRLVPLGSGRSRTIWGVLGAVDGGIVITPEYE